MLEELIEIDLKKSLVHFKEYLYEDECYDDDWEEVDASELSITSSVLFTLIQGIWLENNYPGQVPIKQNGGKVIFMFGWRVDSEILDIITDPENIQM